MSGKLWTALAVGGFVGFAVTPAHAEGGAWGTFGYIHSFAQGNDGNGLELTYAYYPGSSPREAFNIGGFLQAEQARGPNRNRYALGAQAAVSVLGIELGYAYRDRVALAELNGPAIEPVHGLHLAPFLSFGFFSFAFRLTQPLPGDAATRGEYALVLGLKVPAPLHGTHDFCNFTLPSGRPLRGGVLSRATQRCARPTPGRAVIGTALLSRAHARRLAGAWRSAARDEGEAVLAFARLWCELRALGAPEALLTEVQQASRQERAHARVCERAAASFESATPHAYSTWPSFRVLSRRVGPRASQRRDATKALRERRDATRALRESALCALARESLLDGCFGEGTAAAYAARAALEAQNPWLAKVLTQIAREEHSHAALAWRVIAWCLAQDTLHAAARGAVRCALTELCGQQAAFVPRFAFARLPSGFGFLSPAAELALVEENWALTQLRLSALLTLDRDVSV